MKQLTKDRILIGMDWIGLVGSFIVMMISGSVLGSLLGMFFCLVYIRLLQKDCNAYWLHRDANGNDENTDHNTKSDITG